MNRLLLCCLLTGLAGGWLGFDPQPTPRFQAAAFAATKDPPAPVPPGPAVPSVELPAAVKIDVGDVELVPVKTNGKSVQWTVASKSGIQVLPQYPPGGTVPSGLLLIKTKVPGVYDLVVYTALGDAPSKPAICAVTVGTPEPPVPPVPPVPPGPTPGPAVIGIDGFAVLIVYETKTASELPVGQNSAIFGKTVRDYLRSKCAADPGAQDGKAYRIWDPDVATDGMPQAWKDAMARKRDSLPWIVVSSKKGSYEGPLPKSVDETIALLKKYGD